MAISTPVLYLNTGTLQTGDSSPFINSLTDSGQLPSWTRVSGATGPLQVVLCTVAGGIVSRATLATGNTLHFTAKKDPSDSEFAVSIDFERNGSTEATEYYQATSANFAVVDTLWAGKTPLALAGNFEERNSGGDVLRIWNATLNLIRGNGEGSAASPVVFVSYSVQSPTSGQKSQAIANLGLTSLVSGALVSSGTITLANAGKVAVITAANTLGAGVSYTSAATASTLVLRDSSGGIAAVNADLLGNLTVAGDITASTITAENDLAVAGSIGCSSITVSGGIAAVNADFSGDLTVTGDINFTATTTANFGGSITAAGAISAGSGGISTTGSVTAGSGGFSTTGVLAASEVETTGDATIGGTLSCATFAVTANTITVNGTVFTAPAVTGQLTTEERLLRQKRFAVGQSASSISTTNSAWAGLITSGSSAVARLHSYFTVSTSSTVANSRYSLWVEAGAAAVNPHALQGHPFYGLNYAKGLEISFPLNAAQLSGTSAVLPSDGYLTGYFGQSRNTHYTDIVQVGFGFYLKGDGTIQLQALATNGGTVVKSSFVASGLDLSVNASAVASLIRITSDTSGNLTLFVDGVSKCTLAGGPTGLTNVSSSNFSVFAFTMSNGAGTPTKATAITIGEPLFVL